MKSSFLAKKKVINEVGYKKNKKVVNEVALMDAY